MIENESMEQENDEYDEYDEYDCFDWIIYLENYKDLRHFTTKKEAWNHWINYGKKEKRVVYSLQNKEIESYKEIKTKEELNKKQRKDDNLIENLLLKPLYENYGLHYFGWKGVINQLLTFFSNNKILKKINLKEETFFDEWIEKILIWGNKIQNKNTLQEIHEKKCKLISFLHNPPFEKFFESNKEEREEFKHNVIFNKDLLNKNIFELIETNDLKDHFVYLYTLSNSHKKYIYEHFPEYKNNLVSIYHPIDLININNNQIFDFEKFKTNKKVFHIGWWLRNFKTFVDFSVPNGFTKNILIKKDFEKQWNEISVHFDLKKIEIVNQMNSMEYEKIFKDACIFLDLEDAVANNVVLECIKFSTPIIIKKIDSIVEYLGEDYPLYFSDKEELKHFEFTSTDEFLEMISKAHQYLLNMNKTHLKLSTFNKKIMYDLHKLSNTENQYSLTWFCLLDNENQLQYIDQFIDQFKNQTSLEKILLKFMIRENLKSNQEFMEIIQRCKEKMTNIDLNFIKEENSQYYDFLNLCIHNTTTEYLTILHIHDTFLPDFSNMHIEYLDHQPHCDVAFSSFSIRFFNNENEDNDYEENIFYEKDIQLFIDNFENEHLPTSGFVWRKKLHNIVHYFDNLEDYSLEQQIHVFFKKCLQNHLNICCISEDILFCLYI
jgi:hypothetical protein